MTRSTTGLARPRPRADRFAGHVAERQLIALLVGDVPLEDVATLAAHVEVCATCAARASSLGRLDAALAALADEAPADWVAPVQAQAVMASPIGPLCLLASERGIAGVRFGEVERPLADPTEAATAALDLLEAAQRQLVEYFAGRRSRFDLPLDLEAVGSFGQEVLAAAQTIPYGSVATYGEVARRLGRPGAARAVGGALNRNPIPIIVPCHRVLGGDGSLTGYAGGLPAKRFLLQHEAAGVRGAART